jgi:hypothetical protein
MTHTNDEKKILVIYYIEMRTRYFNEFANIIFRQLIKEEHPILSHNKEIIKNIVAKSGSSHWSYRKYKYNYTIGKIFGYEIKFLPNENLDLLIEQADRIKTKSTVLGSTLKSEIDFPILASEKRLGLFPDDGLFNMFEKLTNKDIRAKIKVENERIKSFLTNIREISNVSLSLNGGVRIVPEPTVSDTSGASVVSL